MSTVNFDGDTIQSLARGLKVITAFNGATNGLTSSEVAHSMKMTRPTTRRILITLESMGYVSKTDGRYTLSPRVLELGYSYLSSLDVWHVCKPRMEQLSGLLGHSTSTAVLEGHRVVYVARIPGPRITSISPRVGTRIPAFASSMGRVLLSHLDPAEVNQILRDRPLPAYTQYTETDPDALIEILAEVKKAGWSLVDQELDLGLRALAVPLRRGRGEVVAALNIGFHTALTDDKELLDVILPALLATADQISDDFGRLDVTKQSLVAPST